MKILVFTEGTILMRREAVGIARQEIVRQIQQGQMPVVDYSSHVPIGGSYQA